MVGKRMIEAESDNNQSPNRKAWAQKNITPTIRTMLDEDEKYFLHQSVSTPCLNAIRWVDGIFMKDLDGKLYMDFHGNNVHHIGYGNSKLIQKLKDQLDKGLTFTPRRFTDAPAVALAKKIAEISPGNLNKVLFATGGNDAVEMALKIARAATGRYKFVSFWDAFHGAGFGASSVGGEELFRSNKAAGPLLSGTEHVAPPNCYRCAYGYPNNSDCNLACAKYLRYVLEKEGDVAAVIAEPVRSLGNVPPKGYWKIIREACDEFGSLLIFDDIPNGLGKTGKMFTCEHFDVVPDIMVIGKALGGGIVPISCVMTRSDLDVLKDFALGHYTHEKNPFTTMAALTTINIIQEESLIENARIQGAFALEAFEKMALRHKFIGRVCGLGLVMSIELVRHKETKEKASDIADWIMYRALEKGLSFKTSMGNVLTLTPPLIITKEQMQKAIDIIDECLTEAEDVFK